MWFLPSFLSSTDLKELYIQACLPFYHEYINDPALEGLPITTSGGWWTFFLSWCNVSRHPLQTHHPKCQVLHLMSNTLSQMLKTTSTPFQ